MRKLLTAALACLLVTGAFAQKFQTTNRYGQPLVNKDGKWTSPNGTSLRSIADIDTIPGFLEPYTYVPDKLKNAKTGQFKTLTYTYKKYPTYELKLEVDIPTGQGKGPFPYIMYIHGGGWRNGSYKSPSALSSYLTSNGGVAAVRIDYTMIPDGTIEDAIADIRDAIKFTQQHAKEWNIDPKRFGFSGSSAGGHLSGLMAVTTPGTKVLVGLCGPYDLETTFFKGADQKEPTAQQMEKLQTLMDYFIFNQENMSAQLKKYSPISLVGKNPPPALLIHGTFDQTVPYELSPLFAEALKKNGGVAEVFTAPYVGHGVMSKGNAQYEDMVLRMAEFVKKYL